MKDPEKIEVKLDNEQLKKLNAEKNKILNFTPNDIFYFHNDS